MTLPPTLRSYQDCADIFDRAVADPKGARACAGTQEAAIGLRTRMHMFRKLDREANSKVYDTTHPMHGQSVYDDFAVRLVSDSDGEWWLYIEPHKAKVLALEGLSDVPEAIDSEATEVHQIEDQTNG